MTLRPTKRRSVLPPGTCIADRYELRSVLGQGGSSIVYEARDLRNGDDIAIKVLDPEPGHRATERERMFREARITEQLCHDGIVRVREAGLKLLDFGIAFEIGEVRLTAPGALIGTPSNLAPEQVQLEPMDHRVDVYALGVLVYRMITGRMPFDHKKPQRVLMDIVRMVPRPPSEVLGEGSRLVDTIVMRALEKDPDRRFASVTDFAEALRLAVESTAEETGDQN